MFRRDPCRLSHPMNREWTDAMDLNHVTFRHGKMAHTFRNEDVRTGSHVPAPLHVEPLAHPNAPRSGDHREGERPSGRIIDSSSMGCGTTELDTPPPANPGQARRALEGASPSSSCGMVSRFAATWLRAQLGRSPAPRQSGRAACSAFSPDVAADVCRWGDGLHS